MNPSGRLASLSWSFSAVVRVETSITSGLVRNKRCTKSGERSTEYWNTKIDEFNWTSTKHIRQLNQNHTSRSTSIKTHNFILASPLSNSTRKTQIFCPCLYSWQGFRSILFGITEEEVVNDPSGCWASDELSTASLFI